MKKRQTHGYKSTWSQTFSHLRGVRFELRHCVIFDPDVAVLDSAGSGAGGEDMLVPVYRTHSVPMSVQRSNSVTKEFSMSILMMRFGALLKFFPKNMDVN